MNPAEAMIALVNVQSEIMVMLERDEAPAWEHGSEWCAKLSQAIDALSPVVWRDHNAGFARDLVRAVADGRQITVADRRKARVAIDAV